MAQSNRLIYLALGGAGEIGMNMYLYGYGPKGKERFIMVDAGVTFPNMETSPGVDLIMADPDFIINHSSRLDAIFITHAHEDHIGALPHLIEKLGYPPIYARPFTAALISGKFEREGQKAPEIHTAKPWPDQVTTGPFTVRFAPISHSIPESSALVIDTKLGRIVHSGDFKIDRTPVVGEAFDEALFKEIGQHGVKALTCDSTNIFTDHPGRSETEIVDDITNLVKSCSGLVIATTFASNVARLKTLAEAAVQSGRSVLLMGYAMRRMVSTALETGVCVDFPNTVSLEQAQDLPRNELLILATGSQGEMRAATAQLADQGYRGFKLQKGDTYLFSSKTIPGNERSVARIYNMLSEKGVRLVGDWDGRYHVSGHANRPDLDYFHGLLKPKSIIPLHGEHRHLSEHAEMARAKGIHAVIAPNGAMIDLTDEQAKIIDHVETGKLYLDGVDLIGAYDGVVRDRLQMARRGHICASVVIDQQGGLVEPPWVESKGLPKQGRQGETDREIENAIEEELPRAPKRILLDDAALEETIQRGVRKRAQQLTGKKPVVTVLISYLEDEV